MTTKRRARAAKGEADKSAKFRTVRGISWWDPEHPDATEQGWVNVEPGEERDDIPKGAVKEYLDIGAIEPADAAADGPKVEV